MQNEPTVITPEQIKSATLDINSLSSIMQAHVYGYVQGFLAVKEPISTDALLQALTTLLREPAAKPLLTTARPSADIAPERPHNTMLLNSWCCCPNRK